MKITIKTVKKKLSFEVEIEPTLTVSEVKAKIEAEKPDGSFPQDRMTLIHAGKILANDKLVSDYTIKDGGFLVCMVTKATNKPKPAAIPAATSVPAPVAAATSAAAIPATPATSAPASSATEVPSTPAPSIPAPAAASPAASIGDESFNASVRDLMAMGFPEDQCAVALRAAFLDKNRAVEYLFNGIPDDVRAQSTASATAAPAAAVPVSGAPAASDSSDPLSELRALPQFEAMRTRVRSDPSQLSVILREIGTSNPDVLAAINTNQAEFVRLMNEAPAASVAPAGGMFGAPGAGTGTPGGGMNGAALAQLMQSLGPEEQAALAQQIGMPPDQLQQFVQMISTLPPEVMSQLLSGAGAGGMGAGGMGAGGMGAGGMSGADPPGVVRVELSTEEQAAVERLCALGFDRNRVLETYLICDKNEEWTANYLFDNME